jgi:2'-5' RNA ligase
MRLNFALILPDEVRAQCIVLSQDLAKQYETYFVLEDRQNHPHITVYAAEFPDTALNNVFNAAQLITTTVTNPLFCKVKQAKAHQGYLGIEIYRSTFLVDVHRRALERLAPLRSQHVTGEADYSMTFNRAQMVNLKQYGFADTLDLYYPHFTLTRLKDKERAKKLTAEVDERWGIKQFSVSSIGIYTMDGHGMCQELVKSLPID